jgi:hypothetical protein
MSMPTQREIADHLDMSERNARDVLKGIGISDWQTACLDEIRIAYIRDLRAKAAGRGGSQLEELNAVRIDEGRVKAANGRLLYHEKLRSLIPAGEADRVLIDWASFANREYLGGLERIIQEIESVQKVTVDRSVVAKIAGPTTERIAGYARKLGAKLVGSGGGIQPAA